MSALSLDVGRIRLALTLDGDRREMRKRYGAFAGKAKPHYRVELSASGRMARRGAPRIDGGDVLRCAADRFAWELDLEGGRGRGRFERSAQNLDSFLRTLYCSILPRQGGAMLHAAALSHNGKAHLFVGISGAGKSTISRKLDGVLGLKCLSDELVALRRTPAGLRVFSTPFWGEFRLPRNTGSAPLGKIFFLAGKGDRIIPLTAAQTQSRLLRCLVSFERTKEPLGAAWDVLLEAVAGRPCATLFWDKNADPKALIKRLWD